MEFPIRKFLQTPHILGGTAGNSLQPLFFFFLLEDNCFTILGWFLPYINMNQLQEYICLGFSGMLVVKNLPANAGDIKDTGLIPGLGRSPAGRPGCPL